MLSKLGDPTERRPLRRPMSRCKDNIRMDLKEIGVNTRNWIDSAQDRDYRRCLMNMALNIRFHKPCSYLYLQERDR